MESDDDYQFASPPNESSPPVQHRRLKRLKKAVTASEAHGATTIQPVDEGILLPSSESHDSEALETSDVHGVENSSEPVDEGIPSPAAGSSESEAPERSESLSVEDKNESMQCQSPSEGFDGNNVSNSGFDGLACDGDGKRTKRALDFDDVVEGSEGNGFDQSEGVKEETAGLTMEKSDKKRLNEDDENKEKMKKKKVKSDRGELKPKSSSSNKRREEKERRAHLQQLHAESQRLLRETRNAEFKPIPLVQKPISSILEKIRKRKLEVSKKSISFNNNCSVAEDKGRFRDVDVNVELESVSIIEREVEEPGKVATLEETVACNVNVDSNLDASDMDVSKESIMHTRHEKFTSHVVMDEESVQAFRAPVDDTQDLSFDSQTSDSKEDELPNDEQHSPLDEVLAPSALAMKLKFDSAPPDDFSSDEEDNDKENMDPHPHRHDDGYSSPRGDPVKAFVDEEAMEEDDGDNDIFRFLEDEEDHDNEDLEELRDMIATEFEEKPSDNERRNELHQKWLEQQDAAGTENLMQRLKCGSISKGATFLNEKEDDDENDDEYEDEEGFSDDAMEDLQPRINARLSSKKAKEMISKMFSDQDDPYISSDDEETEKILLKQRLLHKAEEDHTLFSSADGGSSTEVFGLIKELNIAPDTKKKAKASSFFDTMLAGGNGNSSSKSSFLGRASSHSLSSSRKQGTSTARSFIFGRDDSNSRSSISMSEDSSDIIPKETHPTRNFAAKFSSSQFKTSTQSSSIAAETVNRTSLLDLLKRSSMQPNVCHQDNIVDLTQSVFSAFKIPKKSIKIEGRN